MNGVTAQSQRDKGVNYHLNWGANLLHLQEMAREYEPSFQLATLLWGDNIRECKILAAMLMPSDEFPMELAVEWIKQTPTQEIAEIVSKYLFSHLPYAKFLAISLLDTSDSIESIYAFCILGSVKDLTEKEKGIVVSYANKVLNNTDLPMGVRHLALNTLHRINQ